MKVLNYIELKTSLGVIAEHLMTTRLWLKDKQK